MLSSASNGAMRGNCSAASEEPSSATAAQQESVEPDSSSSGGEEASSARLMQRARLRRQAAPRQPLIYPSESEPEGAKLAAPLTLGDRTGSCEGCRVAQAAEAGKDRYCLAVQEGVAMIVPSVTERQAGV